MTRPVLIDETKDKTATPYDTDAQANEALRARVRQLFADPNSGYSTSDLKDHFDTENLDEVDDDRLSEFLCDLWIGYEGSRGVWTNFSSADRWSISGNFPEEEPFGNGDTTIYETVGKPNGTRVIGRNATSEEDCR